MNEESTDSRRKHTRLFIKINAEVKIHSGLSLPGHTRNLSFGGGFINLDDASDCKSYLGLKCQLTLKLGSIDHPTLVPIQCQVNRYDLQGIDPLFEDALLEIPEDKQESLFFKKTVDALVESIALNRIMN